jgi:hypothetical protein
VVTQSVADLIGGEETLPHNHKEKTMSLNKGQQDGFLDVIKFINDPSKKYMHISGGAGTGKTYFISQIAENILKHKNPGVPLHTVAITATTNKAAAVISDAMPHRAGEIGTVYTFMNLRVTENFATGESSIIPTPRWIVYSGTFLIIDEASMTTRDLYKYLEKGLDHTCKVLFVGDKNQLAPVKEVISPIYNQNFPISYLTQAVRNANSAPLMALCEQAKQTVLTGVFTPIIEVPGVIDFVDGTSVQGILEREFTKEDPGKRVISYTNKRVVQYNEYIRKIRGYTKPYQVGEILSNNSSAELMGKERLYTDQIVEVINIVSEQDDPGIVLGVLVPTVTLNVMDVMSKFFYEVTAFAYSADRDAAMKYYSSRKQWDKFFKVKNNFPDLRSVAASTAHKAQGSTYDSVIVDLADIGTCTNNDQTARMVYVALSRPRSRLFIRGQLPERYFP